FNQTGGLRRSSRRVKTIAKDPDFIVNFGDDDEDYLEHEDNKVEATGAKSKQKPRSRDGGFYMQTEDEEYYEETEEDGVNMNCGTASTSSVRNRPHQRYIKLPEEDKDYLLEDEEEDFGPEDWRDRRMNDRDARRRQNAGRTRPSRNKVHLFLFIMKL
ncbi:unnamed protein product, partial [Protopolystoma xenopodis]